MRPKHRPIAQRDGFQLEIVSVLFVGLSDGDDDVEITVAVEVVKGSVVKILPRTRGFREEYVPEHPSIAS